MKLWRYFFVFAFFSLIACKQEVVWQQTVLAPFMYSSDVEADSILQSLSLDEKLGQLIIYNCSIRCVNDTFFQAIQEGKIGGLILENQTVDDYISTKLRADTIAPLPLLYGTKELVSLTNQFTDALKFPSASTLASIKNEAVQTELNQLYLDQCNALKIDFSLSPSVIKNSKTASFFNYNAYEQEKSTMFKRSYERMDQLQRNNILAIGTDFSDLEYYPNDTIGYLDSVLFRYYNLTFNGLSGWKIDDAIFEIDTLDRMFPNFAGQYLQEELDFGGLIMADHKEQNTLSKLIHAGTDLFVTSNDPSIVLDSLKAFVESGILSVDKVDQKVRKILKAKAWTKAQKEELNPKWIQEVLQHASFPYYVNQLYQQSAILANNYNKLLPYTATYQRDFRVYEYAQNRFYKFEKAFQQYARSTTQYFPIDTNALNIDALQKGPHATKIVLLDGDLVYPKMDSTFINTLNNISKSTKLAVINFGNPFVLSQLDTTVTSLHFFERNSITERLAAQILMGGLNTEGQLPLALSTHLPFQHQLNLPTTRLRYNRTEEVGIAPEKLVSIDAIVNSAIANRAFPGAQVLVAKSGNVVYNKSFGYHTYNKKQKVKKTDLYDIASLTKTSATTLAIMKLMEEKKLDLNDKLSVHLDLPEQSKLGKINIRALLLHQSALQPNMPIADFILYEDSLNRACNPYFCNKADKGYTTQIANQFYLHQNWEDSLWQAVYEISPYKSKKYRYSDVNANLLQHLIEKISGQSLDNYVYTNFYQPLNLTKTRYRPLEKFQINQITPTANDEKWRKQLIHGYVHDESAALLGGVAGNAGLFSTAEDLAVLYQMLLNGGTYGDKTYLNTTTINNFTAKQKGSERGLGFDKARKSKYRSTSTKASSLTYGHTGFTGTAVWVDPKEELVFIFLSNRIYPDINNKKLFRDKIRQRIHDVVYKALNTYNQKLPSLDQLMEDEVVQKASL